MFKSVSLLISSVFVMGIISLTEVSAMNAQKIVKLSNIFSKLEKNNQFNGAVLIAKDGKILFRETYGTSNFSTGELLTVKTGFELASVSKVFTAIAIHQLVERQKINYGDSLTKFFPDLPYKNVTIGGMLSHTSGLFDVYGNKAYRDQFFAFYGKVNPPYSNKNYLEYLIKFKPPLLNNPLVKTKYSNTAYVLLGLIIEQVSGQEFDDYISEHIFKPAGMKNTFIFSKMKSENVPEFAKGHKDSEKTGIARAPNPASPLKMRGETYGDDDMVSTLDDMLAFDRAFSSGILINKKTIKEALSPLIMKDGKPSSYGLGVRVSKRNNLEYITHTGSTTGFWSYYQSGLSQDGVTIILLTNVVGKNRRLTPVYDLIQRTLNDEK